MKKRLNLGFAIARVKVDSEALFKWRERKPAVAEPMAGSLRTICWVVPLGTSGIGLPAEGLAEAGGGGGIRTPGGLAPTSDFKSGAFNHSATPPKARDHVAQMQGEVNGADAPGVRS